MIKKILFSLLFSLLLLPALALAAQTGNGVAELKDNLGAVGAGTGLGAPGDADLKGKVANVLNIVLGFLGVVAVIYIIYAGFKWIMAEGNDEVVKEAKSTIRNAIIGIMVVFLSYIVINFVASQLSRATGATDGGGGGGSGGGAGSGGECSSTCTFNSDEGIFDFTCDLETVYDLLSLAQCQAEAAAATCDALDPTWTPAPACSP